MSASNLHNYHEATQRLRHILQPLQQAIEFAAIGPSLKDRIMRHLLCARCELQCAEELLATEIALQAEDGQ
jgi:hypothetical protein